MLLVCRAVSILPTVDTMTGTLKANLIPRAHSPLSPPTDPLEIGVFALDSFFVVMQILCRASLVRSRIQSTLWPWM